MTNQEAAEIDRQLDLRGWSYDPGSGEFRAGPRRLEWEEIVGIVPRLSFTDLMAYERQKHDEWRSKLAK
jgi:hypothetical protein